MIGESLTGAEVHSDIFFFSFLATPYSLQDLSSLARDRTHTLGLESEEL